MNITEIFGQARKMQEEMEKIKNYVSSQQIHAESGGGMVKCVILGSGKLVKIEIADELIKQGDKVMIEDLVVACVNKAIEQAAELSANEMKKMGGMLPNIPGLNLDGFK